MKKQTLTGIAVAVAVLAGGYVAATAYTSYKVAAQIEAQVARVKEQLPFVQFIDTKMDRGLFSSTFSTGVCIGCANADSPKDGSPAGQPFIIQVKEQIYNGPLPGLAGFGAAVIDSQITLPDSVPAPLRNYVNGLKPGDMRGYLSYGNSYRAVMRLPAAEFELDDQGGKLGWPEWRMTAAGQFSGESGVVDLTLPELNFHVDKGSLKIAGLSMHSEVHGSGGGLWMQPGAGTVKIGSIDLQAPDGDEPFSMQISHLNYEEKITRDSNDLLGIEAAITGDASVQAGKDAKPHRLENVEFQVSYKNIHAPTFQKYIQGSIAASVAEFAELIDAARNGNETPATARSAQARRAQQEMALLLPLLQYDPAFSVDKLALTYEGHRGELSFSMGTHGFAPQEGDTALMAMPRLIQALTLRSNVKLPVAWVEQAIALERKEQGQQADAQDQPAAKSMIQSALDMLIAKGYVIRDGDMLTSSAVSERGVVNVNGKPLQ
jgi:uncharacterized protein YdgA (DUF945 family)